MGESIVAIIPRVLSRAVSVSAIAAASMVTSIGSAASSLPHELAGWRMPAVQVESVQMFVNHEVGTRRVYRIRSWFFGTEEIHALENAETGDKVRLVMHSEDGGGRLSSWSDGEDTALGATLLHNRQSGALLAEFSPLNDFRFKMDVLQGRKAYQLQEVVTSPNGLDGTATLQLVRTSKGSTFRDDSIMVAEFRDGTLRSVESFIMGNDLRTGTQSGPFSQGLTTYSRFEADYPSLPRRTERRVCFPPDRLQFEIDWDIGSISPIPPGVTAGQVIRELTAGLSPDRWPAREMRRNVLARHFAKVGLWGWVVRALVVAAALTAVLAWLRRSRRAAC